MTTFISSAAPAWLLSLIVALASLGCAKSERWANPEKTPTHASAKQAPPTQSPGPQAVMAPKPKEGSVLLDKPSLTVHIDAESIRYDVLVNGAYVASDSEGSAANETWPINHFLRSGSNELSIIVWPWQREDHSKGFDAGDKILLQFMVQRAGDREPAQQVVTLGFAGAGAGSPAATAASTPAGAFDSARGFASDARGDVHVGPATTRKLNEDGVLLVSRTLTLSLPFLEWDFLRSDSVPTAFTLSEEQLKKPYGELLAAYEDIWKGLRDGDLDRLMPLFEERSRETDAAFYFEPGTTQRKLRAAFEKVIGDKTMELAPVRNSEGGFWSYEVGTTGKLMRLSWGPRSSPLICFLDKETPEHRREFSIVFRKKGDKFIVSR